MPPDPQTMHESPDDQQQQLPSGTTPNGAGQDEAGKASGDDMDTLKAELARVKKAMGQYEGERAKRQSVEKARQELADRVKYWEESAGGMTADQLREWHAEREKADLEQAKAKGDVEKLLQNRDAKHAKDLAKKDEERGALQTLLDTERSLNDRLVIDAELNAQLSKIVAPDLIDGAFAMLRPKAKAVQDDESPYGRRPVMQVGDDELPIPDFLKQWAEADPKAQAYLLANRSQGGGAPPTGRPGSPSGPRMQRSKMTHAQKVAYMDQYGVPAYEKLPM